MKDIKEQIYEKFFILFQGTFAKALPRMTCSDRKPEKR